VFALLLVSLNQLLHASHVSGAQRVGVPGAHVLDQRFVNRGVLAQPLKQVQYARCDEVVASVALGEHPHDRV
jgi:hypothetical protein